MNYTEQMPEFRSTHGYYGRSADGPLHGGDDLVDEAEEMDVR